MHWISTDCKSAPQSVPFFRDALHPDSYRDAELCRYIEHYAELSSGLWLDAVIIT
jgi:hypothetical protein